MSADLRCYDVRRDLAARLDGEAVELTERELEQHLAGCAACRRFESAQHAIRRTLRLTSAQEVPDVVPRVLAAVARDRTTQVRRFRLRLASVAAIAAAMLVLATQLPLLAPTPQVAGAGVLSRRALVAARSLESYKATFAITEREWHRQIPIRSFRATVWYRAPESFRLRLRDLTRYPDASWPSNDVDLIASPSRAWIREPFSCPPEALPGCAIEAGVEERTVVRREPFDGTTLAPTDIVVPLESLATSEAFSVLGRETVDGRDAIHVALTYRQGFALVDALQAGGSWTDILPLDRVDAWLEEDTWFPIKFRVIRPGLQEPVLEVDALDVEASGVDDGGFAAPVRGTIRDGAFVPDRPPGTDGAIVPDFTAGLPLYRTGTTADGYRIVTFAEGATFVKVTHAARPRRVDLEEASEMVRLGPDSVGFYRPAERGSPRRIDVFGANAHVRVETNLRRHEALRIARSVPVEGRASWDAGGGKRTEPLTADELLQQPFIQQPTRLPPGYRAAGGVLTRARGKAVEATVIYLPSESGLEGSEIRLFQSTRIAMLPPSSEDLVGVRIGGVTARWSRERGELEWIDPGGIYRAISAPSFDLVTLRTIAASIG